jgi:hypothetical protein
MEFPQLAPKEFDGPDFTPTAQSSRLRNHRRILEPILVSVLPHDTAFGGTSGAVIAIEIAAGQCGSVVRPVL